MSFLDQLLAGVKNCAIAGTVISVTGAAPTINFVSGATGVYNAGTKSYDITITAGGGGTVSGVDVAGSDNAHVYVGSISGVAGAGGTVQLHISLLQFDSNQTSAGIAHAAPTGIGITPASLILTPQPAYSGANTSGTKTPGSLVVALALPVSGGNNARLAVTENSATFFQVGNNDPLSGAGSYLYLGSNAATAGAWAMAFFDGGTSVLEVSSGFTEGPTNLQPSMGFLSNGQIQIGAGTASSNPADINLQLSQPHSGNHGAIIVSESNGAAQVPFFHMDNGTVSSGSFSMWCGNAAASPTSANEFFSCEATGASMAMLCPGTGSSVGWNNEGSVSIAGGTTSTSGPLNSSVLIGIASATTGYFRVNTNYAGPFVTVFEAGFVGSTGRRVTALNQCASTGITTTQMPTGSGDGVTYIGNRQTARPTVSPTQGAVLFAESGQLWIMPGDGSNTAFEIQAAVAGGGVVTGVDVAGANNTAVYVVSLSGAGGSTAAIPLRAGAYISVTHSQPIIGDGSTTFVSTNSTGGLLLNANGGKQISLQVGGVEAAHVGATALTLTAGVILAVTANNNIIGDGTHTFLSTDGSVNIIVGDNTTHGVQLWGGGADLCSLTGSGSADYIAFGLPATASTVGNIRFSASSSGTTTRIGIGNHAATLNLNVLSSDTGDNMTIGDATNGAGIAITSGNGDALQLQVNATTYLQCNASVVTFSKELNYAVTGGTATSASAGANGAVPAQVVGYLNFSVSGTPFKIPYFGV